VKTPHGPTDHARLGRPFGCGIISLTTVSYSTCVYLPAIVPTADSAGSAMLPACQIARVPALHTAGRKGKGSRMFRLVSWGWGLRTASASASATPRLSARRKVEFEEPSIHVESHHAAFCFRHVFSRWLVAYYCASTSVGVKEGQRAFLLCGAILIGSIRLCGWVHGSFYKFHPIALPRNLQTLQVVNFGDLHKISYDFCFVISGV
jgi:hypothetical protein